LKHREPSIAGAGGGPSWADQADHPFSPGWINRYRWVYRHERLPLAVAEDLALLYREAAVPTRLVERVYGGSERLTVRLSDLAGLVLAERERFEHLICAEKKTFRNLVVAIQGLAPA